MNIRQICQADPLWLPVAEYASTCSWSACARLAVFMKDGSFTDWERLFVAEDNGTFMGFCALAKPPSNLAEYTPLVKWLFVEERYRSKRLGQKLLDAAGEYAKELGYEQIFLTTWHIGLYEKYGFNKLCDMEVRDVYYEGVYGRPLHT